MASTINASTAGGGGIVSTADSSGVLQLQTAGTAAVTVDASQNVGIGTASPAYKVDIQGNTAGQFWASIKNTNAGASSIGGWFFGNDTYSDVGAVFAGSSGGGGFAGANGMNIGSWKSAPLAMFTNNTERMRIDANGNFLVGTTTGLDGGNGATIKQASYYISSYRVSTTAGNYVHAFYSDIGGTATAKYAIYANGTAGAISDERYKKNLEPARNYLEDLTKVDVIKYNWITDEDEAPKELGFSAQQIETIFPGLVDTVDNKDADGNVLSNQKLIKRDVFLPMLIKSIQELKAIVDTQAEQIKALEAK